MLKQIFKRNRKKIIFCKEMHKLVEDAKNNEFLSSQIENKLEIFRKKQNWDWDYDVDIDTKNKFEATYYVTSEDDIRTAKKLFVFKISFNKEIHSDRFFDIKNYRIEIIKDC